MLRESRRTSRGASHLVTVLARPEVNELRGEVVNRSHVEGVHGLAVLAEGGDHDVVCLEVAVHDPGLPIARKPISPADAAGGQSFESFHICDDENHTFSSRFAEGDIFALFSSFAKEFDGSMQYI